MKIEVCGCSTGLANSETAPAIVTRVRIAGPGAVPTFVTRKLMTIRRCPSGLGSVDHTVKSVMAKSGAGAGACAHANVPGNRMQSETANTAQSGVHSQSSTRKFRGERTHRHGPIPCSFIQPPKFFGLGG